MTKQRVKILVVEDEALTAQDLRLVLESCNYEVLPLIGNGEEALKLIQKIPPDLVLMDIKLDGKLDGIETAKQLRQALDIPIIYVTASSDKLTMERAKITDPHAYILKPFNEYDLTTTIEVTLYKSRIEKQIRQEKEINAALAQLSQTLLKSPSPKDISIQVQDHTKQLTHSTFCFVGYVNRENGYLFNPNENQKIANKYRITSDTVEFKSLNEMNEWVLKNKQPIIANNLSESNNDIPFGEFIPVHNFIAVPALIDNKLVGILAAINKNTNYDEKDKEIMQRIATIYALALQQKKTESELALYQNHLEELVEARTRELAEAYKKLKAEINERERAEEQLLQADKMVALGTLVSGVAHEINNPNNFIMMNAPFLNDLWEKVIPILEKYYQENGDFSIEGFDFTELKDTVQQLFAGILEGTRRIKNIVKELKDYSRPDNDEIEQSVDINLVVKSAITLTAPLINKATKQFKVQLGPNIPSFPGRFQRLEQVIINLIQNSCQALPDNTKSIVITTCYNKITNNISIEIKDEGIGIEPQHLKLITNPFFTTKRDSGGTGLGLSISSNIITNHKGTIEFQSTLGKGTLAKITLPVKKRKVELV